MFVLFPSRVPPRMLVLHVTNGDSAAGGLARSGLPGDVLSWRDNLHDGPVPPDNNLDAFRATRGEFIASRSWTESAADVVADFEARDARLDGLTPDDEVVLWFEPDLYDQLHLVQVLARLAAKPAELRPRTTIVPADCYLGPLTPDHFAPLYKARRAVGEADLAHGTDAWRALTSDTPNALLAIAERLDRDVGARNYNASDMVRLPHLAAALRRQLEEYPDVDHGLSRSERQLCEALAPGELSLGKLFQASHHASESWTWLGDWSFAWYAQRLSDCAKPLVTHPNGTRVVAPARDYQGFWERTVVLTPFGHDVVRARADAIAVNGIDRWIGGVHLTTQHHWRWDARINRPIERRG